jgi:hypothetical protein
VADTQELLKEIYNCPIATSIRAGQLGACQKVVQSQNGMTFQPPEPWSGRLDVAPILFLSSNPSIDDDEMYPDPSWEAERIADFFQNRFSSPSGWVDSHLRALRKDGTRTDWVRYWAAARARTSEILDKPKSEVKPGFDFALTEVVHCKSRSQEGVKEALECCSQRYLGRVLSTCTARVIIVCGEYARRAVCRQYESGITSWFLPNKLAELRLGDRSKILVFLPAPNERGSEKTLAANIRGDGISVVRSYLELPVDSELSRQRDNVKVGNEDTAFRITSLSDVDKIRTIPSSAEALLLAKELIDSLHAGIKNTQVRPEWTDQNLELLRTFAKEHGAESYPSDPNMPGRDAQFLWDFIAYKQGEGILLAAESEHDNTKSEIARDFEKLLYVRSPVKLMLCRLDHRHPSFDNAKAEAHDIKREMESCMRRSCDWYTPGEVFVLYCVWWAESGGANRDIAFLLQIGGDLQ